MSELLTVESGSSFSPSAETGSPAWPTPVASERANRTRKSIPATEDRGHGRHLSTEAISWPTPTVHGDHNREGVSTRSGDGLATRAREWPTPMTSDADRGSGTYKRGNPTLKGLARGWPTPTTHDGRDGKIGPKTVERGNARPLNEFAVSQWMAPLGPDGEPVFPTPTAASYGISQNEGEVEHKRRTKGTPSLEHRVRHGLLPSHLDPTTPKAGTDSSRSTPVLNPVFVEMLQGWPAGWTGSAPVETGSLLRWRQQLSSYLSVLLKRIRDDD